MNKKPNIIAFMNNPLGFSDWGFQLSKLSTYGESDDWTRD